MATIFEVVGATSLAEFYEILSSRDPEKIKKVFVHLAGDAGDDFWPHLNGMDGLVAAHNAIISTLSGLTPEEEEEAEKKQHAADEAARELDLEMIANKVIAQMGLTGSPLGSG